MVDDAAPFVEDEFNIEVMERFGVLPGIFCPQPGAREAVDGLWSFAKSAYLDNPLPSLFKERLFVQLSRFCENRYCIVRHVGFLIGEGRPAGDRGARPETVEGALALLGRPVPDGAVLDLAYGRLLARGPAGGLPEPGTIDEGDAFDALTAVFLEPGRSGPAREALRHAFGESGFERLSALLAYVRAAHHWIETHPELACEPDMRARMERHPELARLLLDAGEARAVGGEAVRRRRAAAETALQHRDGWLTAQEELFGAAMTQAAAIVISRHWKNEERAWSGRARIRRHDGTWHWFENRAQPLFDERSRYMGHTGISTDIDVSVHAERVLRDSEERYQALFAASPVPVMVLAPNPPDYTITAANDAYLAATLTTREGLIGRRLFDAFTDDPSRPGMLGSQALGRSLARVLSSRQTDAMGRVRYDIVAPDGSFEAHWWLAINAPMTDAAGRIVAIIHQVTRVTEIHLAEVAEQEHQARQAFLLKLNDALRPLVDAKAVRSTAAQVLGEHLGVHRALYCEVDGDHWVLSGDYESGIVPLPPGRYAVETYGAWMMDTYRGGGVLSFSDSRTDPRFCTAECEAMGRFEIIAALGVGLVKDGHLVAILTVHSGTPRTWTDGETSLLAETAERTWAAIERAKAEEALRESEARFAQFAASSSDALWIRDAATLEMEYASPAVEAIYGVRPERLLDGPANWATLIVPQDRAGALAHLEQARAGDAVAHEFRIRRPSDASLRWIRDTDFPLRDAQGRVQRIGGIAQDVTGAKLAAERQVVLVAELQHRTRNLIAVVKGIADDTMRETGPTERFRAAFADRLSALSRVQGLLSRSEAEPITIGSLLRLELDALGAGAAGGRVTAAGPEVRLRPSTVQTLALALHELATNARKHGALSHDAGRLAVTWRRRTEAGESRLAIEWVETGLERAPERPASGRGEGGYGRELIEQALPHALGARTSYALSASGVRCTIDLAVRPGKGEP